MQPFAQGYLRKAFYPPKYGVIQDTPHKGGLCHRYRRHGGPDETDAFIGPGTGDAGTGRTVYKGNALKEGDRWMTKERQYRSFVLLRILIRPCF